ncbi:hypothetical protein JL722_4477 [Aureococcus anophagefferens]|nr:hypothetical protein JL722_4477 [Aureococcus anophagefferens]
MWRSTKMSEEDPDGYSELLTESAKHMAKANGDELAEGMEPDDAKANELMSKLMTPDALTPAAGYVIKAALKYNGGKLMINCCAHPALQPPNDAAGLPVDVKSQKPGWSSASGLQIPMVVGSARPCAVAGAGDQVGSGQAIDVLFHPWVLDQVAAEGPRSPFKRDVSALAVRWVAAESKLAVDTDAKSWKHINSSTRAAAARPATSPFPPRRGLVPVRASRQPGEEEGAAQGRQAQRRGDGRRRVAGEPPRARAGPRRGPREGERLEHEAAETAAQKKKKVMIQEVAPDDALEASTDGFDISSDAPAKPKKPAVTKGFLAGDKAKQAKPLYPNGSSQGDSQKEGTYSRFMSKCKVVDTTQMTKEEQDAALRKHAEGGQVGNKPAAAAPKPPAEPDYSTKAFDKITKGFLDDDTKPSLYGDDEAATRDSRVADPVFDAMMADVDRKVEREAPRKREKKGVLKDFKEGFIATADAKATDRLKAAKAAKAAAPPPPPPAAAPPADAPGFAYESTDLERDASGRRRVQIVAKLDGAASMKDVDLDVAGATLRLKVDRRKAKIALPFAADPAAASAKSSKKKQQLTVVLTSDA